jgi:hypothetical protein
MFREINGREIETLTTGWKNLSHRRFKHILDAIKDNLGLDVSAVRAELYKLAIYEKGSYVNTHQEAPRNKNHFATLLIFLPSYYTGGDFVVHHQHYRESVFNFSVANGREAKPLKCHYVLLLNNNKYDIKPIKSGIAVTLIYNLNYDSYTIPKPTKWRTKQVLEYKLQSAFDQLRDYTTSIGIFLTHSYSMRSCGPNYLIGEDKTIYDRLICLPKDEYKITISPLNIEFSAFTSSIYDSNQNLGALLKETVDNGGDVEISVATISDVEEPPTKQINKRARKLLNINNVPRRQYHHVAQLYLGGELEESQVGEVQFVNVNTLLDAIKVIETDHEAIMSNSDDGTEFKGQCVHVAIIIKKEASKEQIDQEHHPIRKKQKIK